MTKMTKDDQNNKNDKGEKDDKVVDNDIKKDKIMSHVIDY